MPQQINLLDASLQRKREPLGSLTGLAAVASTLIVVAALVLGLQHLSAQMAVQAGTLEHTLADLQARSAAVAPAPASRRAGELARLRALEAGQRRLRAALESGQAGSTQAYSEYLTALSRQTDGTLWLTGFMVAQDGRSLDIGGRMTDPRQLPGYLRRLNSEPLFRGREFAQLSLKAVDPSAASGSGLAEFTLRSTAGPAEAPR